MSRTRGKVRLLLRTPLPCCAGWTGVTAESLHPLRQKMWIANLSFAVQQLREALTSRPLQQAMRIALLCSCDLMQSLVYWKPGVLRQMHPCCWLPVQDLHHLAVLFCAGLQLCCHCSVGNLTHFVELQVALLMCRGNTAGMPLCCAAVLGWHRMQGYQWLQTPVLTCSGCDLECR